MKSILTFSLLVAMILLTSLPLMAADNSLTSNPLSLIFGNINLEYERSLNDHFSLNISGNYFSVDDNHFELDGTLYSIGGKYYFKEVQHGSYIGFSYQRLDVSCKGRDDDNFFAKLFEELLDYGEANGISLSFGYRKITDSGFTFDLGCSMNYFDPKDGEAVKFPMIWATLGYGW